MSRPSLPLFLLLSAACATVDGRVVDTGTAAPADSGATDAGVPEPDASGRPVDAGEAPGRDAATGVTDPDGGAAGGADAGLPEWPSARTLTCEEVRARMLAGDPRALYLNVADEEFYSLGHLEGSLLIPWDLLPGRLSEVDPSRHVVIYCRRGVRSESAQATLTGAGYTRTWIMEGGIERWIALGYPTVE